MGLAIQVVKGMKDILPQEIGDWQFLEESLRQLLSAYGYEEIRSPLLEKTEVFKRAIGQATDIVEKEMYTLEDKGGDLLSLRPEGTAQCVRAVLENGLLYNQTQKLWYMGPMFRRERPQKGRLRQFHQLGVEAFGFPGPDVDIELLLMMARLWNRLEISDVIRLELNTLGLPEERVAYRDKLVEYFSAHEETLDSDSKRRLKTNPLRILDSKEPSMQNLIQDAPQIQAHLGDESKAHFETITNTLEQFGIAYTVNPRLVRGLDYYTHTVYEWTSELLGAQSAVCAGGRYDQLVSMMGGQATPSTGFALGIERLLMLLQEQKKLEKRDKADVYIVHDDLSSLALAEKLRDALPDLKIYCHHGGGGFKSQFKKADKSGAQWAIIYGADEREKQQVTLKPLRESVEQKQVGIDELISYLQEQFKL